MSAGASRPLTLRGMGRAWLLYGISSVASRMIGFLLLPVYTRVLTPEEYGIRAMVTFGVDLVAILFSLGVGTAIARFYGGEDGRGEHPEAVSTGILAGAVTVGAGVLVGELVAPWAAVALFGSATHAGYLRLGLAGLYAMTLLELGFVYLRLRQRPGTVAAISLSTLVATVAVNLLFVVAFRWGVAGILYGEILVFGVAALAVTTLALREVGLAFSPGLARRMLRYGAPLILMPAAWLTINRADTVFLTHAGSLAHVGVYALALQCAQVLLVAVIQPFRDVWDVSQFTMDRGPEGQRLYARTFRVFTAGVVGVALAGALAADDVLRLLAPPVFSGAAALVPVLLAAHVVTAVLLFLNSGFLVRNRTATLGTIAGGAALLNLAANAVLVPAFLASGAAAARVLTVTALVAATWLLARRLWPLRIDLAAAARAVGCALFLFALGRLVPDESPVTALTLKAGLVVLYAVLAIWLGALDREPVAAAFSFLRQHTTARWRRQPAA